MATICSSNLLGRFQSHFSSRHLSPVCAYLARQGHAASASSADTCHVGRSPGWNLHQTPWLHGSTGLRNSGPLQPTRLARGREKTMCFPCTFHFRDLAQKSMHDRTTGYFTTCANVRHLCQLPNVFDHLLAAILQQGQKFPSRAQVHRRLSLRQGVRPPQLT